ncbi:helix-turn-helix domain-containing protein [Ferribacterium limneticum]|uniref:helix-turn-helix domain-containing protein n=1 Tax=Ferribacterium limneticum TaxID=76259 RepID=UPI001CF831EA|nr:helix-turn-helix transcriptional regulator [Ferribacterium limneticum]UCV22313.1 helix-turn-helix transcriptional regulator [Ferribacterium limneticum]
MNRVEALASVIRDTRQRLNISQEKLAETAKLHRNGVGRIERGKVGLSIFTLWLIADALGVSASELMRQAEILAANQHEIAPPNSLQAD